MKGDLTVSELALQTTGLTRRFGSLLAVDHVDLQVPVGSIYGYLGRNGAGKTTTIQMLMGLLLRTEGEVDVLGLDPLRQERALKLAVSYVPERPPLDGQMTVAALLRFGRQIHPHWDAALAEDLRQRLDLPADRRLEKLSRGMQGKAMLLAALSSRPRLLILDDPTMGLDVVVRREFMENLVAVLQETGVTVFFSSHQLDDVERIADWIGLLHRGRLIVQSPLEQLKATIKRVVALFPEPAPPFAWPGLLQHDCEGRQQVFICRQFAEDFPTALRAAGAVDVRVEDCSLEDLFIAFARGA